MDLLEIVAVVTLDRVRPFRAPLLRLLLFQQLAVIVEVGLRNALIGNSGLNRTAWLIGVGAIVVAALFAQFHDGKETVLLGNAALAQVDDPVGVNDIGNAVGNHEYGLASGEFIDPVQDFLLGAPVQRRGGLVEQEHAAILEQRARHALL